MNKNVLGLPVKCAVTGFKGTATERVTYLNGCIQYRVTPKAKKGKPYPSETFIDEGQLQVRKSGAAIAPVPLAVPAVCLRLGEDSRAGATFEQANAIRTQLAARRGMHWAAIADDLTDEMNAARRADSRLRRQRRKRQRKVMARSAVAASRIVGDETARLYVRGDSITLTGRRFGFRIRKGSLWAHGHGAMEIDLTDPAGDRLCSLCVYADNAPSLDQLSTLALYVMAGDEESYIEAANLFNVAAAAFAYPPLRELQPREIDRLEQRERALQAIGDPLDMRLSRQRWLSYRSRRRRNLGAGEIHPPWARVAVEDFSREHVEDVTRLAFRTLLPVARHLGEAGRESQGAIGVF